MSHTCEDIEVMEKTPCAKDGEFHAQFCGTRYQFKRHALMHVYAYDYS